MFLKLLFLLVIMSAVSSVIMFTSNRKHLFNSLITLEFIVIMIFMILAFFMSFNLSETFNLMYFLVFSVCESVLGLSLLVVLVRSRGSEFFSTFNLLKW